VRRIWQLSMLTVNLLPVWFCRSSLLSEKYWGAPDKKSSPPAKLLKTIGARLKLSAKLWQEYVSDRIEPPRFSWRVFYL
ncbi:hypothetical protein ACFMF6_004697, partial [Escherichia coli]